MKKINLQYQRLLISLLLTGIVLLVYGQVVHFNFANIDDQLYVTQNSHIQNGISISGIVWAFISSHAANWHPLTSLSLMIDYNVYGLNAGGYHFTNLFFHMVNTLLLFFLFNKMTGTVYRSFVVAALFALHPMHVESVAWVSARKDVLSTFFWLLTMWTYVLYAKHPGTKRYIPVLIFFALGLMSKPMVVTLPFVLLLLDYWPLRRSVSIKNLIIEKIPLFVLTVASSVVTYIVQKHAGAVGTIENFPLDVRIYNAIISYGRYIEKALLPVNLSVYYPHPGMWPIWQVGLAGCLIILLSILIWRKSDRYPYLPVGWLWYLGTLVPVIGIIQVGSQAMADRYSYIPFIGLFIMMAWGVPDLIKNWPHKKNILGFCSALIILSLSFLSWQRCQLWGDNVALWTDALKNYEIAFAYNIRGIGYAEKGDNARAIEDYNAALAIKPDAIYYNNRATAYGAVKQYEKAFDDINRALKIMPTYADAYYNRGLFYYGCGKYDLAVQDFTSAVSIKADMYDAFLSRGVAFGSQKQYEKALADFNQALIIHPNFLQAYYNRGIVYNIYQQYNLAIDDFTEALRIKPDYAEAHNYIGMALLKSGRYEEAMSHFKKALQIKPDYMDAAKNLREVTVKVNK
jgi:tetratricopeptide (TPR) repeat protein